MGINLKKLNDFYRTCIVDKKLKLKNFFELTKNLPVTKITFFSFYKIGSIIENFDVELIVEIKSNCKNSEYLSKFKILGNLPNGLNIIKEEFITFDSFLKNKFVVKHIYVQNENCREEKIFINNN